MTRGLASLSPVLLSLAAASLLPGQQSKALEDFEEKRDEILVQAAHRHLEYGLDLRKQGLTTQAAEQILLAAETARGKHPGVSIVVSLMRTYDDRFWKKSAPRPTRAKINAYAKRARALDRQDERDRVRIGVMALQRRLPEEAHAAFESLLLDRDEPLEFDAKGRVELDTGAIPEEESTRLREEAIEINWLRYVRDAFLKKLPEVRAVAEVTSEALRVRTDGTPESARALHALGSALLPEIEEEIGARPRQRLSVFVFVERATYEAYLDAAGLGEHKVFAGVATGPLAVLTSEALEESDLYGVFLHELAHAFHFAVSAAAMPSWYAEGLAETFGGEGTFAWTEGRLVAGGLMETDRLRTLLEEGGSLPLREMLEARAIDVWNRNRAAGRAFYAQAWAFQRYLRHGATREIAERFAAWEDACRAGALGAAIGGRPGEGKTARDLFLELFEADLPRLEEGFRAWLKTL